MAKFVFRLQTILGLKQKLEDQKKLEFGKAVKKLEIEKQHKIELENEKDDCIIGLRNKINTVVAPVEIKQYENYIDFMKKKISEQAIVISIEEKYVEKKRLELIESIKERKMLETLREKDYENYLKEEQQREQKVVDEIVSFKYNNIEK